ncbi:MAG: D-alanyl-D-alanine carboxypeptidase [Rhizobiales bacterium]|nr:D-alanyl-D-alanine carboxypeptidase [Hyphomicrobiales bacterium]
MTSHTLRFAAIFLACLWQALAASAQDADFSSKAAYAILIDARSGRVLYEKDADTAVPPASMSKLMTMIEVFETLKAGKVRMETEFPVSENAWRKGGASSGGSTMYADLNSRIKLSDLIQGIIVQSANDACIIVAEGLAGSEDAFVERLNQRGKAMGLKNATFKNTTGLPDPEHRMSVRDLAVMARYIVTSFPEHYKYYSQPNFTWNKITQQNRNPLLRDYTGADGMKTGFTKEAGYGLVGSVKRGDRRLIMVVAGSKTANERKQEAQRLLDWGFSRFRPIDIYAAGESVGDARVWGGTARWVPLVTKSGIKVSLSADEQELAEVKLSYTGPLRAPVQAGTPAGAVRIVVGGETVVESPVETAADVAEDQSMWARAFDSLLIMAFGG